MMVYTDHLTATQQMKLAVCDAWLLELADIIDRIRAKEPVYRVLSPMWEGERKEEFWPDELDDKRRTDPPTDFYGRPKAGV